MLVFLQFLMKRNRLSWIMSNFATALATPVATPVDTTTIHLVVTVTIHTVAVATTLATIHTAVAVTVAIHTVDTIPIHTTPIHHMLIPTLAQLEQSLAPLEQLELEQVELLSPL